MVDSSDNVIITGYVEGILFGTNQGNNDAFVVKYSTTGTQLWAKQFGGGGNEDAKSVTVDSSDNVIVTGYTNSSLFGTNQGSNDVFVVKYSTTDTQHGRSSLADLV